jgi:uncharacterized protein YvpB
LLFEKGEIKVLLYIFLLILLVLFVISAYFYRKKRKAFIFISVGSCIGLGALLAFSLVGPEETIRYTQEHTEGKKLDQPVKEVDGLAINKWVTSKDLKTEVLIDAPLISQLPELPRGCEVTSLAMLLNEAGVEVDKMTLAEEVKKDKTPYRKENGQVYFGNPYDGFVGNMYTYDEPGYGVYHGPISELAKKYLPNRIIDMTGSDFDTIKYYLSNDTPVWVIVNTRFRELEDSYFEQWQTPSRPIKITYKEHSVLITGYDSKYIYFNDPLANMKNRRIEIDQFRGAWKQMGSQAITYIPKKGV